MPRRTIDPTTSGRTVAGYRVGSSTDDRQLLAVEQPKDLYATRVRTITASDLTSGTVDVSGRTPVDAGTAQGLSVGGTGTVPGATLTFQVVLRDSTGADLGATDPQTITVGSAIKDGAVYLASIEWVELYGAATYDLIVLSISSGSWQLAEKLI